MTTYVVSLALSIILYTLLVYVSYIASFILYKGISYRLIAPTTRALVFLMTSYTSIIADIFLFYQGEHLTIIFKNTIFLLLLAFSYIYARFRRGSS